MPKKVGGKKKDKKNLKEKNQKKNQALSCGTSI